MKKAAILFCASAAFILGAYGFAREGKVAGEDQSETRVAQDPSELSPEPTGDSAEMTGHAECSFFGADHDKIAAIGLRENLRRFNDQAQAGRSGRLGFMTMQISSKLPPVPPSAEIKFPFD